MSDDLAKRWDEYIESMGSVMGEVEHLAQQMRDRIEKLESENEKLRLGLEVYKRERDRFKHNKPEITGEYFLAGGHGYVDENFLPQFVQICPAYGCAWVKIYEDTGRTVTYEGS